MQQVGIWRVDDQGLKRLQPSSIGLEKNLENWIEQDPELLEQGLEIVGRQLHVKGGYLDLLGINPQGQWVVIELKSGTAKQGALTQALYYASCIATMPWDELCHKMDRYLKTQDKSIKDLVNTVRPFDQDTTETRDVIMYVVGTGISHGLDRMVDFLSGTYKVPITLVSYEVFQIGDGHKILVRELAEPETIIHDPPPIQPVEEICSRAQKNGIGKEFRIILDAAERHNLHPRPYRASIMYTSPSNRTRMLFTVRNWTQADGLLRLYFGAAAFAEFYPVTEETVRSIFGQDGWRYMTIEDVEAFVANLDRLFKEMGEGTEHDD